MAEPDMFKFSVYFFAEVGRSHYFEPVCGYFDSGQSAVMPYPASTEAQIAQAIFGPFDHGQYPGRQAGAVRNPSGQAGG